MAIPARDRVRMMRERNVRGLILLQIEFDEIDLLQILEQARLIDRMGPEPSRRDLELAVEELIKTCARDTIE